MVRVCLRTGLVPAPKRSEDEPQNCPGSSAGVMDGGAIADNQGLSKTVIMGTGLVGAGESELEGNTRLQA